MSSRATNPFAVPKRRVEIEFLCHDGARHRAAVFLASQVPQHEGAERLSDLLEGPQSFVPALLLPGEKPVWLHRDGLVWVRAARELEPDLEAHTLPTEHDVELVLSGGEMLRGLVSYVRPDANARLTDYLNEPQLFFTLLQGDEVLLVHKRHVLRAALAES